MAFLVIFLFCFSISTDARSIDEIEKEIQEREEELGKLDGELQQVEAELATSVSKKNEELSEIAALEKDLENVKKELEVNELRKKKLEKQIKLKSVEKEGREQDQNLQIQESYIAWKIKDGSSLMLQGDDIFKQAVYYEVLTQKTKSSILGLTNELKQLNKDNKQFSNDIKGLEKEEVALAEKQKIIEEQIEQYNSFIAQAQSSTSNIRAQQQSIQLQIEQLSEEQKKILEAEKEQTSGSSNGGTIPLDNGDLYFSGSGRDSYQGHGVGFSQFGAYGAAQIGWSAEKILGFYYNDTVVKTLSERSVTVQGHGTISADAYVAGLGEVSSRACGTQSDIDAWQSFADEEGWSSNDPRRDKFAIDDPSTVWDCFPEEAIKAQVIAARSYAVSGSQPICTTAACQVYSGGDKKAWAAWETSNQYVVSTGYTHNGQIIRAVYSSENSQGYGTADNDTVWSNFSGDGSAYSYLRHADDSSFSFPYAYTNWQWRSNGYSKDDINDMFDYAVSNYGSGSSNQFISGIKSKVGELNAVSFERDGSNRVKKVIIQGNKGSDVMAGWFFKAIWNDWVYNVRPSGEEDYIYSLTFWLEEA